MTLAQEWLAPPDVTIIAARVLDPYILLQFSNDKLFLLLGVLHLGEKKLVEVENATFNDVSRDFSISVK